MATETIAGADTGDNIVASGSNVMISVEDGKVDFSTDAGTTWVSFHAGEKWILTDGLTTATRNSQATPATVKSMPA